MLSKVRAPVVARSSIIAALVLVASSCGNSGASKTAFTVWAFGEAVSVDAPEMAIAGAMVAFDPPGGGERAIATTAEDGHVTFEGEFDRGGASITIFHPEHVLISALDVSPETVRARPNTLGKPETDLVVVAPLLDNVVQRSSVELRGGIAAKREASSTIDLSASGLVRLGSSTTKAASYVLRAPKGRPFFLIGHETRVKVDDGTSVVNEELGSFRLDVTARAGDSTLDIDVTKTKAVPVRTVHLHAAVSNDPRGLFGTGSRGSATIISADSTLLVAPIQSARRSSATASTFDFEMALAETEIAPERPLTRASLVAGDGSRSVRVEPGVVADGTTWSDFPLPPFVAEATRVFTDPLPLDDFPAGADLGIEVYAGTQLAWILSGPPGGPRGPVSLPAPLEVRLPQLVAISILAQMDRVVLAPRGAIYRRVAISRDVLVRR